MELLYAIGTYFGQLVASFEQRRMHARILLDAESSQSRGSEPMLLTRFCDYEPGAMGNWVAEIAQTAGRPLHSYRDLQPRPPAAEAGKHTASG